MATPKEKQKFQPLKTGSIHVALGKFIQSFRKAGDGSRYVFRKTELSYLSAVKAKVKGHPDYKGCGDNEIRELAENLTDEKQMEEYFSHLLNIDDHLQEVEREAGQELTSTYERQVADKRASTRLEEAASFQIYLILTPLQNGANRIISKFSTALALEYGPLHASLIVDDTVLEWNTSNLIIPHYTTPCTPVMKMSIEPSRMQESDLGSGTQALETSVHTLPASPDVPRKKKLCDEIDLVFDITASKHAIISKLIAVAVDYNRYHFYNVFSRNSQNFVRDAMAKIGVTDLPQLGGGQLKEYFERVKKAKHIKLDFETHQMLDDHIAQNTSADMSVGDLEFLLCQYFQFHTLSVMNCEDQSKWECEEPNCRMAELESCIDKKALLLSRFKHE